MTRIARAIRADRSAASLGDCRKIVYAGIAIREDLVLDDDPELVAERACRNGYDAETLAGECGIAWPMRPELLDLAAASGMMRWARLLRADAARRAIDAGCPLRVAAAVSGLSHQAIANIARGGPR